MKFQKVEPHEIEARSFEMITEIIGDRPIEEKYAHIIKRAIHTSADFDYLDNLVFSDDVETIIVEAIKAGAVIVTDTNMAKAGINKKKLAQYGSEVHCFIADEDIMAEAKAKGVTRARLSMEKAANLGKPVIFAIGNAPTALIMIDEMVKAGEFAPVAVIGVPVGFVNVVEAKELIMETGVPYIVAKGRKGGSNVAAAICNAMIYKMD